MCTELSSSLEGPPIPKMNHAGRAGKKSQRVYMLRLSGGRREAEGVLYSNSNSALQKVHTVTREREREESGARQHIDIAAQTLLDDGDACRTPIPVCRKQSGRQVESAERPTENREKERHRERERSRHKNCSRWWRWVRRLHATFMAKKHMQQQQQEQQRQQWQWQWLRRQPHAKQAGRHSQRQCRPARHRHQSVAQWHTQQQSFALFHCKNMLNVK